MNPHIIFQNYTWFDDLSTAPAEQTQFSHQIHQSAHTRQIQPHKGPYIIINEHNNSEILQTRRPSLMKFGQKHVLPNAHVSNNKRQTLCDDFAPILFYYYTKLIFSDTRLPRPRLRMADTQPLKVGSVHLDTEAKEICELDPVAGTRSIRIIAAFGVEFNVYEKNNARSASAHVCVEKNIYRVYIIFMDECGAPHEGGKTKEADSTSFFRGTKRKIVEIARDCLRRCEIFPP